MIRLPSRASSRPGPLLAAAPFLVFAPMLVVLAATLLQPPRTAGAATRPRPNVLFVIMDDVGADLLTSFNPQAPVKSQTPVLNALAASGVRFTNHMTMPECSPTRSCFFTGRLPLRTGVNCALLEPDLPAAQISPDEMTAPRVLKKAGYRNALFGKYHLGGPSNNPDGNAAPGALGWDYFDGILQGGPPYIDETLGGQYQAGDHRYSCGFPTGAQRGVGWFRLSNGKLRLDDNEGAGYTGQEIVALGGVPALDPQGNFAASVAQAGPPPPAFDTLNGYYVWRRTVVQNGQARQKDVREYLTTRQTDSAVSWVKEQKGSPWFCTVSYSAIHTPYQQPPTELYPPGFTWPDGVPEDSRDGKAQRVMGQLMLTAMDQEIGRLLVGTGIASWSANGQLIYNPAASNTMLVIAGDNGTYLTSVVLPYNPARAKGTPYETGVRAPLIVAGPLVSNPGRSVDAVVSCVDLFQLFGEIAGVNVHRVVPRSHMLDCAPLLPYVTDPGQPPIRAYAYTQQGSGVKAPDATIYPTVLDAGGTKICTDKLFYSQQLAETEGGEWFGPGGTAVYSSCCDVRASVYPGMTILADATFAVRSQRYKLVMSSRPPCDADLSPYEFYDLTPTSNNPVGLDRTDLLVNGDTSGLTSEQLANYQDLLSALNAFLASEPACYGDGNLDKKVDNKDLKGVRKYRGQPSRYDFNNDGVTDDSDLACVKANRGHNCLKGQSGSGCL